MHKERFIIMKRKSQKIPAIVFHLSADILFLLEKYLTKNDFDENRFSIELEMLLSQSKKYTNDLLFKDYNESIYYQETELQDEAYFYLTNVLLERRIRLATVNSGLDVKGIKSEDEMPKSIPTNMHLLLKILCSFSNHKNRVEWKTTDIQRSQDLQNIDITPDWFRILEKDLHSQRNRLGNDFDDHGHKTKDKFGPYWLTVGAYATEVGEELNLIEVLSMVPLPLESGFSQDKAVRKLFLQVILTLNNRYGLLRSCGLPPKEWHSR